MPARYAIVCAAGSTACNPPLDSSSHSRRPLHQWADPARAPCLLIDDMVDSRWTFTVAAWLLRENGSGPVFPLALAQTGQSD